MILFRVERITIRERNALYVFAAEMATLKKWEAAKILGVSYNHLVHVLDGHRRPSWRLACRLAEFIGVPVHELFPGTEWGDDPEVVVTPAPVEPKRLASPGRPARNGISDREARKLFRDED